MLPSPLPPHTSIPPKLSSCYHTVASSSAWLGRSGGMHGSAMTAPSGRPQPSTHPCSGIAESLTPGSPPLRRTPAPRGPRRTLRLLPGRGQPSQQKLASDGTAVTAIVQGAVSHTSVSCAKAPLTVPRTAQSCNLPQPTAGLALQWERKKLSSNWFALPGR